MNINSLSEQLCSAINQFLDHKDFSPEGKVIFKQKQKQLINFSKEIQCLPVCIAILSTQKDQKISYFASVLLKDKLKYDFYQLDSQAVLQTYNMLTNLIKNMTNTSKILVTNIVLCLVYLYIHQIDKIGTIAQFFSNLFGDNLYQNQNMRFFLKFLELAPQQIKNHRLVIDEQSRTHAQKLLENQQTQIFNQMHNLCIKFTQQNVYTHSQYQILLKAFSSWLELDSTNQKIIYTLHQHKILDLAFKYLHDDIMCQASANCIKIAIQISFQTQNNQHLFLMISQRLFSLIPQFDEQLKQCSYETVQEYAKLLCQYGSNAAQFLVTNYNQSIQNMIHRMLIYTQTEQIEAFSSLVDFWQCFLDAMIKYSENSALNKQTSGHIMNRLIIILFQKIKYSWNDLKNLNDISEKNLIDLHQRAEDITQYRQQAGYVFFSIAKHLGQQNFVRSVLSIISNLDKSNLEDYWARVQAMICSIREVVQNYPAPTQEICQLVLLYEQLDTDLVMVKRSFCRVFHELFTIKQKNQQFIFKMLGYVVNMLDNPLLSDRAQKAFNKCCRQNGAIVAKHIEHIYKLLNQYPNKTGLLSGIAEIIKQSPQMASMMPALLKIQIQKIKEALTFESKSSKKKQILSSFESIFSLLKSVPQKNADDNYFNMLQQFLNNIWPLLKILISDPLKKQNDEDRVVQQVVKLLKIILRAIPQRFLQYLHSISTQIVNSFQKYPISTFVYYYQIVLTQYRTFANTEMTTYLLQFFKTICLYTFKHIQNFGGINNLSILADDFLGLAKRIVTYDKLNLLLQSNQIDHIFKLAIMGLQSSQPRVASSCSQFFQIVFMIYWTPYSRKRYEAEGTGQIVQYDQNNVQIYEQLKQYVLPSVPALITDLFKCLQKVPAQSARDNILDCLIAIALAFPNESSNLWKNPLEYLNIDILTVKQKEKVLANLQKLGSSNMGQFNSAEIAVSKLFFLISKRYMHRITRQNLQNYK